MIESMGKNIFLMMLKERWIFYLARKLRKPLLLNYINQEFFHELSP